MVFGIKADKIFHLGSCYAHRRGGMAGGSQELFHPFIHQNNYKKI